MFRSLLHDHPQGSSFVLNAPTTYQPPASSFVFFGFVAVCPIFVCMSGVSFISVIQTNQLTLYREIIAVHTEIHTKHRNGYPDWGFSVFFPQLKGKYHAKTHKDGARPAFFLVVVVIYVFFVLFYVLFVLFRSLHSLCVYMCVCICVYWTSANWWLNCCS
jgi:amino acid transporter